MIIRTNQGDLIELKRNDFVNDRLYYESIANAKGIPLTQQITTSVDMIIKQIGTAGRVDTPNRRKNSGQFR